MVTRRVSGVLLFVWLSLPAQSWADRHRAGAAFGPTWALRSNQGGVGLAFDIRFCKDYELETDPDRQISKARCKPGQWRAASLLVAVSYVSGQHEDGQLEQFTGVAGPRFAFLDGPVQPFVHALVGAVREVESEGRRDSITGSVGGGIDIELGERFALRPQLDLYWIAGGRSDIFLQPSIALEFRFD